MDVLLLFLLCLSLLFLFGALDDFVFDLLSFIQRDRVWKPSAQEWTGIQGRYEQGIAVMIPAWREDAVLRSMVQTNLKRLKYSNFKWFLGVYPNDEKTLRVAKALEKEYPEWVSVVLTDRPGPTSKAHCLNCIIQKIEELSTARREGELAWVPAYAVIHDAEDVIDPDSFKMVNALPEGEFGFVQVPVLSMPITAKKWVAGTYMDEFADVHLRELPGRKILRMPIPSAGVGTFFQWDAIVEMGERLGYIFDENNLTEDYEISLRMARLGVKQKFLLSQTPSGRLIATREFFPDALGTSVRQKTRWTVGIALQSASRWGVFGKGDSILHDLAFRYALWRDRKSLFTNPLTFLGLSFLLIYWAGVQVGVWMPIPIERVSLLRYLVVGNLVFVAVRLFQRVRFSTQAYSFPVGMLAIPRYFLSTLINGVVAFRAVGQFFGKKKEKAGSQRKIEWDKTDHFFPSADEIENLDRQPVSPMQEVSNR